MIRIWGKTVSKNKIIKSHLVQTDRELDTETIMDGIGEICEKFDIPRPILLEKHVSDMNRFLMMRFFCDDFIEKVDFDKFEIEVYMEKK